MVAKRIVAFFEDGDDAQSAINRYTTAGFVIDELSLVMRDGRQVDPNEADSITDSLDEENLMQEDVRGLLEPLESIAISPSGVSDYKGDFVVAGALVAEIEDHINDDSDSGTSVALDKLLLGLNLEPADVQAYENRLIAGEVLLTIVPNDENYSEVFTMIADAGPLVLVETDA